MNKIISDISDYIFISDEPEKVDAIFLPVEELTGYVYGYLPGLEIIGFESYGFEPGGELLLVKSGAYQFQTSFPLVLRSCHQVTFLSLCGGNDVSCIRVSV